MVSSVGRAYAAWFKTAGAFFPQWRVYLLPEPHGQVAFRGVSLGFSQNEVAGVGATGAEFQNELIPGGGVGRRERLPHLFVGGGEVDRVGVAEDQGAYAGFGFHHHAFG